MRIISAKSCSACCRTSCSSKERNVSLKFSLSLFWGILWSKVSFGLIWPRLRPLWNGFANFYRHYIWDLSLIVLPLTYLASPSGATSLWPTQTEIRLRTYFGSAWPLSTICWRWTYRPSSWNVKSDALSLQFSSPVEASEKDDAILPSVCITGSLT